MCQKYEIKRMDAGTLHKFQAGDHTTFTMIMREYQEPIYHFILRMTGNPKDAEDLTQETFVKTYLERTKFRGDSSINTWIYRIAANLTKNHLRWRSIRHYLPLDALARMVTAPSDDTRYEEIELREKNLLKYLQQLSPRQRSVFLLKYFHRLSHQEVANILDISVSSSKTNFHYAVKSLKELVRENNA